MKNTTEYRHFSFSFLAHITDNIFFETWRRRKNPAFRRHCIYWCVNIVATIPKNPKHISKRKKKSIKHLSPVTCHLSPVTCHLSPDTCHLSPVTCLLSPVTCHLMPVTCHLSPVTDHLSPKPTANSPSRNPCRCTVGLFAKTDIFLSWGSRVFTQKPKKNRNFKPNNN